jgi:energy-coupling factor transport system permease protein
MHPFVRIVCLIAFAVALQFVGWRALAGACVLLAAMLMWRGLPVFLKLLRRARWLLLSILLIYAYATPGEYLPRLPDIVAPTYEGLRTAAMQMGRLGAMLAALSVLLASSTREDIMVGVYLLLQPLRPFGLDPERFAARLWLTLHYVETMPQGVFRRLREHGWRLDDVLQENVERPASVQMLFPKFSAVDVVVLLMLPLAAWLLI